MRGLISSVLFCILLICHRGYAYNEEETNISDCLASLELDISTLGGFLLEDIKPNFFSYLLRSSLDEKKKNCLAACVFQKARIINDSGRFTGATIPMPYRDRPGIKVNACKDVQEFCDVGGCLLDAMFS